jgi:hypothetical protein
MENFNYLDDYKSKHPNAEIKEYTLDPESSDWNQCPCGANKVILIKNHCVMCVCAVCGKLIWIT